MRAELILMGKRIDMAPQSHRRALVVLIYATLISVMIALWFVDRWRITGVYLTTLTILINRLLLGGYHFGGLVKRFDDRSSSVPKAPPPFLLLGLRLYDPRPEDREYRNDERELQQRDHAHYLAYQAMAIALVVIWIFAYLNRIRPSIVNGISLLAWVPTSGTDLIYGAILAAIMVSLTLPQSILLWIEPNMVEFEPEE